MNAANNQPKRPQMGHTETKRRQALAAVERISPANRPFVADFVQGVVNSGGRDKWPTACKYASALMLADRFWNGKPFRAIDAADCKRMLSAMHEAQEITYVHTQVVCLRKAFKTLYGLGPKDRLPGDLDAALYVKEPRAQSPGRLISEAEFFSLLDAVKRQFDGPLGSLLGRVERSHALLWTLWDSGFRAGELLSLNVGDVAFDGAGGANLCLRPEAEGLKSGARSPYVVECVGALRSWLELHPAGHDAKAPLFTGLFDRTGYRRLHYQQLYNHLNMLGRESGVNASSSRSKPLSAHDFRHTCATRKAKGGWMEAQLRSYFGWSPESHMPAYYVHLALGDMREQVRLDSGVDEHGYRVALEAGDKKEALLDLLGELLAEKKGKPTRTQVPPDWQRR